jgi:multidrug resistance efflux pump
MCMSVPFSRTIRSIRADRHRLTAPACLVCALAAWLVWFTCVPISIYETSQAARLEVAGAAYPVEAVRSGAVSEVVARVGQHVAQGDPLLRLDADKLRRQLAETESRRQKALVSLPPLERQVEAEQAGDQEAQAAAETAILEARTNLARAVAAAEFTRDEAERIQRLLVGSLASEGEARRAEADATAARLIAETAALTVERVTHERDAGEKQRAARRDGLNREMVSLQQEARVLEAEIETLRCEVTECEVRAPVAGQIGEMAEMRPGTFVRAGDRVATIVPQESLRLVAYFPPAVALGRIRVGQPALIRFHGFPWGQYGSVGAEVASVASEVRDGLIRVECALRVGTPTRIPLQHGLPGSVEIEVERVSPGVLVLRLVGKQAEPAPVTKGA